YVVARFDDSVICYAAEPATGKLKKTSTYTSAGSSPRTLCIHPNGKLAFVNNTALGTVSIFTIDQTTGALSPAPAAAVAAGRIPLSISLSAHGSYLFAADSVGNTVYSFKVDATTGTLAPVCSISAGNSPWYVGVDADERAIWV